MTGLPYVEHVVAGSSGAHVAAYHRMLGAWSGSPPVPGRRWDAASADAVRRFQSSRGTRPTGTIGPATHAALRAWADADATALLLEGHAVRHPVRTARRVVVEAAWLVLERRTEVVYSGPGRPTVQRRWQGIDDEVRPPSVPRYADCSSLATWLLWLARDLGATDPSARAWRPGSTHTMERHGRLRTVADAQPGTLVHYAGPTGGRHVAVVVERVRGVPLVLSLGDERGPLYLRYDYRRARGGRDEVTSVRDHLPEE